MRRTVLVAFGLIAGLLLVAGSYSALAGRGPVADVATTNGPDNQADDGSTAGVAGQDGEEVPGNQKIAQAIAGEFGVSADDVLALHDEGIGFGALFKLYAIARAKGMSIDALLATIPTNADGGHEFGFGNLRKSLTAEQLATLASGPKNLGKLVSDASNAGQPAEAEGEAESQGSSRSNGQGPPPFAKAKGHR